MFTAPRPELLKGPAQRAALLEDHDPGEDPRQIARPQGQQDGGEEEPSPPRGGDAGHVIGEGEREHDVGRGDDRRHLDRAGDDRRVGGGEELVEVGERPAVLEDVGERVDAPERRDEHHHERRHVDDEEPRERRAEGQGGPQPRATPERRRDAGRALPRPLLADGRHRRVAYAGYPMICVQAVTQLWNGTQSFLPLSHVCSGVFHSFRVW